MANRSYFTNRAIEKVIRHLRGDRAELITFLESLAPELRKDPDGYIALVTKLATPPAKYKFVPDEKDKFAWMQKLGFRTILDVGAWKGDSARSFHQLFPDARIYSFEPLHDCYARLKELEGSISGLKTFNVALGSKAGKVTINRSGFSPSSSLLKMNALHKEAFPFTAEEVKEEIEVRTLDSFLGELELEKNVLLKIDVQGFEEQVLKGAVKTLDQVKMIIIELTFVQLYEGQPLFDPMYRTLTAMGFEYAGSSGQLLNPNDGTICQQNGIFIKRGS